MKRIVLWTSNNFDKSFTIIKRISLSLFVLVNASKVYAQGHEPSLIPLSPTAAALGKYGDVNVSAYTGQISPSINLLNIKLPDFSFPISISYSSAGLKVQETPSSVGMGWTINSTGVISRQVKGIPDEQKYGFNGLLATGSIIKSLNDNVYLPTSPYQNITEDNFKIGIGDNIYDGEPDLFNFSFMGQSGKFFFDETQVNNTNKTPIIIPKQPLSIVATFNPNITGQLFNLQNQQGLIEKFVVKDSKGNKYTFDKKEGSLINDDEYTFGKNIVSSWFLSKIETTLGNLIEFNYIQRTVDLPHVKSEYQYLFESPMLYPEINVDMSVHTSYIRSTMNETVLKEIIINQGKGGRIEFIEESTERTDWILTTASQKPKALKEIVLRDGLNQVVKKFAFQYVPDAKRLLLRSVQEYSSTGIASEPHVFEYYAESDIPTLPFEGSNVIDREDHWGFYNANTSQTLIPNFQTQSISGINTYFFPASNRNPDFQSSLIGQLKKIVYPTKGYSEFVYEMNSYYGAATSQALNPCSGNYQTVSSSTKSFATGELCPGVVKTIFTLKQATTCVKIDWNIKLNSPNQDIIDGEVFVMNETTGQIYTDHTLSCINGASKTDGGTSYVMLPAGTYSANASLCREVSGTNTSFAKVIVQGILIDTTNIAKNNFEGGGLRIKEVKSCIDINSQCLVKEYQYVTKNNSNVSSGSLVVEGRYFTPVIYTVELESASLVKSYAFYLAYFVNSSSQIPLTTTAGHYVGYNTVTITESTLENSIKKYNGKTIYDYVSPIEYPDIADKSFPYWNVSLDWRRGGVEKIEVYDANNQLVNEEFIQNDLLSSASYRKYINVKVGKYYHNLTEKRPTAYLFKKYFSETGFTYPSTHVSKNY